MKTRGRRWVTSGWAVLTAATLVLFALLELWRPCFFLTDDTFSLHFPVLVGMGERILAGSSPFVSDLFGGDYPLWKDPVFNPFWHPLMLLFSLLTQTPIQPAVFEVWALIQILAAVLGFHHLVGVMGSRSLVVPDRTRDSILALSYGFSMFVLLAGSSWFAYLSNVAVAPWLLAGWLDPRLRRGCWTAGVAAWHGAVAGYPSSFAYTLLLMSPVVLWTIGREGGWRKAGWKFLALILGALAALPFLLPSLISLSGMVRPSKIAVEVASEGSMPVVVLLGSIFAGGAGSAFGVFEFFGKPIHAYAFASTFGAGWALAALVRRREKWSSWDLVVGAALVASALLVSRPDWLGQFISRLPFLGMIRWPCKEIFLVVFWIHVFALAGSSLRPRWMGALVCLGAFLYFLPLVMGGPPSFNALSASRSEYLSGRAARVWKEILRDLPPDTRVVPVTTRAVVDDTAHYAGVPWILFGGHNFPLLFGGHPYGGYSATLPRFVYERTMRPRNVFGIYYQEDIEALLSLPHRVVLFYDAQNPGELRVMTSDKEPVILRLPPSSEPNEK